MKELPVEKIARQFSVITSADKDFLIRDYISPVINGRTITFKNDVKTKGCGRSVKSQKFFDYCKQYVAFYQSRSYQFLFHDYSLGRFIYEFDDSDHLLSYNLYWNPCPLRLKFIEDLEEIGWDFSDYIDNMVDNETVRLDDIILRTPIRLDYIRDYDGTKPELHPDFHMHFQNKNTRVKSEGILTLYSYLLFIIENCYPDIYKDEEYQSEIENLRRLDREACIGISVLSKPGKSILGYDIHTLIKYS
ncbi:MAG: DUF2290 domain-containing protein [Lachnospiraceae bacterium]|nr:DUF2290 domain-containing protein [Lachnospiraceae bacterium]